MGSNKCNRYFADNLQFSVMRVPVVALLLLLHIGELLSHLYHAECMPGVVLSSATRQTASYITSTNFLANLQCSDVSCGIEGENRFIHTVYGLWDHSDELPVELEGSDTIVYAHVLTRSVQSTSGPGPKRTRTGSLLSGTAKVMRSTLFNIIDIISRIDVANTFRATNPELKSMWREMYPAQRGLP